MDRKCCRCGLNPRARHPETGDPMFICAACQSNPTARFEIETLWRSRAPVEDQRRRAIAEFHWRGGWGRA